MKKKNNLKLGAGKIVLQVISVSVKSGVSHGGTDTTAIEILQRMNGFGKFKEESGRITAVSLEGETIFFLEYDASNPDNQKRFELVRSTSGARTVVETGYTMYIQTDMGRGNSTEVFLRGDNLTDWELKCKVPSTKTREEIALPRHALTKPLKGL